MKKYESKIRMEEGKEVEPDIFKFSKEKALKYNLVNLKKEILRAGGTDEDVIENIIWYMDQELNYSHRFIKRVIEKLIQHLPLEYKKKVKLK